VYWTDKNASSYEPVADAVKINNEELSLYTLSSDNIRLAADYRGQATTGSIPIGILLPAVSGKQTYQLKLSDYEISSGSRLVLHDKWKNSYTDLRQDAVYTLEIDPANAASIGENRLVILITK
jgi:hypothetical protein